VNVRIIGGGLPVFAVSCGVFSALEESVSMLVVRRGRRNSAWGPPQDWCWLLEGLLLSLQFQRRKHFQEEDQN
jgi:hypothetical protein